MDDESGEEAWQLLIQQHEREADLWKKMQSLRCLWAIWVHGSPGYRFQELWRSAEQETQLGNPQCRGGILCQQSPRRWVERA